MTIPSPTREAMLESKHMMAVSMACGHVAPIEQAMVDTDRYCCPVCGLRFHIAQSPPKVYPSGFVMPGNRRIVIDHDPNNATNSYSKPTMKTAIPTNKHSTTNTRGIPSCPHKSSRSA